MTNNLYYQIQRLRHTRDKLAIELKKEKLNSATTSLFRSEDTFYLKKIIIMQSACIAFFGIVYVSKFFL